MKVLAHPPLMAVTAKDCSLYCSNTVLILVYWELHTSFRKAMIIIFLIKGATALSISPNLINMLQCHFIWKHIYICKCTVYLPYLRHVWLPEKFTWNPGLVPNWVAVIGNSTGAENALGGSRLRRVCTCAHIHFRCLTKYTRTGFQTNDRTKVEMICTVVECFSLSSPQTSHSDCILEVLKKKSFHDLTWKD